MTLYLIRKVGAGGGVLDGGQRRVDRERLGKELGALDIDVIFGDAADASGASVSGC